MKKISTILRFLSNAWHNGFLACLKKCAVFKGRATRFEYWSYSIFLTLILSSIYLLTTTISIGESISSMDYALMFLLEFVELNTITIYWIKVILLEFIELNAITIKVIFHFDIKTFYDITIPRIPRILLFILSFGTILLRISVSVRRLHDIGRSGWWLIPLWMPGILDSLVLISSDIYYTTPLELAICGIIAEVSLFILSIMPTSKKNIVEYELPKKVIIVLAAIIIVCFGLFLYKAINYYNYIILYNSCF